jgi:hypothetical protein
MLERLRFWFFAKFPDAWSTTRQWFWSRRSIPWIAGLATGLLLALLLALAGKVSTPFQFIFAVAVPLWLVTGVIHTAMFRTPAEQRDTFNGIVLLLWAMAMPFWMHSSVSFWQFIAAIVAYFVSIFAVASAAALIWNPKDSDVVLWVWGDKSWVATFVGCFVAYITANIVASLDIPTVVGIPLMFVTHTMTIRVFPTVQRGSAIDSSPQPDDYPMVKWQQFLVYRNLGSEQERKKNATIFWSSGIAGVVVLFIAGYLYILDDYIALAPVVGLFALPLLITTIGGGLGFGLSAVWYVLWWSWRGVRWDGKVRQQGWAYVTPSSDGKELLFVVDVTGPLAFSGYSSSFQYHELSRFAQGSQKDRKKCVSCSHRLSPSRIKKESKLSRKRLRYAGRNRFRSHPIRPHVEFASIRRKRGLRVISPICGVVAIRTATPSGEQ